MNYPADLYLEGSDQHRGWFQSSLLTSVAVNGEAPYRRVLTHGFVLDEKGRKMSKSLGNVVDPAVLVEGGSNEKQDPAYGADVLRLWVSSVDYSADVSIGPGIVKQLADVYRKVRNTARYLLGNLHDFDPRQHAVAIADLPLLDRWMLARTAELIEAVNGYFKAYEFYRFYQALQNFCVVDLSNVYLDIAKDRLYVSGAADFRRRSCQTVLHLVVERLAGLIAPVLCHMAEDIWQNLPYPVAETSVFERGWPDAPEAWSFRATRPNLHRDDLARLGPDLLAALDQGEDARWLGAIGEILALRQRANRELQVCRANGQIGSSLEARLWLCWPETNAKAAADALAEAEAAAEAAQPLREALTLLSASRHPEVDNLSDWLLVSSVTLTTEAGLAGVELLVASTTTSGLTLGIARAPGHKCERCWHYSEDIGSHPTHPTLCGRCVAVLE